MTDQPVIPKASEIIAKGERIKQLQKDLDKEMRQRRKEIVDLQAEVAQDKRIYVRHWRGEHGFSLTVLAEGLRMSKASIEAYSTPEIEEKYDLGGRRPRKVTLAGSARIQTLPT